VLSPKTIKESENPEDFNEWWNMLLKLEG